MLEQGIRHVHTHSGTYTHLYTRGTQSLREKENNLTTKRGGQERLFALATAFVEEAADNAFTGLHGSTASAMLANTFSPLANTLSPLPV
jgi:hypothetical protein